MSLFNANTNAEAIRQAAIQERRRLIVERAMIPRLTAVFNRQAKKAAKVYVSTLSVDETMLSMKDHTDDLFNVLFPSYNVIVEKSIRYVLDEAGKSKIQKIETKKDSIDFVDEFVKSWVLTEALKQSTTIAETSFDLVRAAMVDSIVEGLSEQQVGKDIFNSLGGSIAKSRSKLIARTETHTVSQKSVFETVKQLNTPPLLKRWIPSQGDRTRETHREMLKQEPIPNEESFKVRREKGGYDKMEYCGDPNGSAENVCNCRCAIVFKSRFR
jgi:hypothetical protein